MVNWKHVSFSVKVKVHERTDIATWCFTFDCTQRLQIRVAAHFWWSSHWICNTMANQTELILNLTDRLEKYEQSLKDITTNNDAFFLIVMGIVIYCEYFGSVKNNFHFVADPKELKGRFQAQAPGCLVESSPFLFFFQILTFWSVTKVFVFGFVVSQWEQEAAADNALQFEFQLCNVASRFWNAGLCKARMQQTFWSRTSWILVSTKPCSLTFKKSGIVDILFKTHWLVWKLVRKIVLGNDLGPFVINILQRKIFVQTFYFVQHSGSGI